MLRFAATPTGDMHIGDLRIALFNYIIAKQKNEDFIVRIEDMDTEHNVESKETEILDILALFGVEYSQVIHQSQNIRFHSAMALQLLHEKKAFSCFCSDNWIENKKAEAKAAKQAYQYDDACRNLSPELVIDNTNPFTVRINRPTDNKTIDSFIIMNQAKKPTYNFASAIDDMLSDITSVVCHENDADNVTKQVHVRTSLDYDKKIDYIYVPNIVNEKDETLKIKWLLEAGYLPEAILNYLISLGNQSTQEIFSMSDAIKWFDISNISNSPTRFDINRLKEINQEYLKNLDAKELSRYVGFADEEIGELARIYLSEVGTTKELKAKIAPIFMPRRIPKEFKKQVKLLRDAIKNAPYFEKYEDFKNHVIKKTDLEDKDYLKPMHILLTNTSHGPDITQIYKYIKNYLGEIIK